MPQQASQAQTSNSSHHKLSIKAGGKNSPKTLRQDLGRIHFKGRKKFLLRQRGGGKVELVKHEQKVVTVSTKYSNGIIIIQ